jgi:TP901 family phage tail tape measure protein
LKGQSEETFKAFQETAKQLDLQYQRHARNAKIGLGMMGVGAAALGSIGLAARGAVKLEDQIGKLRGLLVAKGFGGEEKDTWAERFSDSIKNVATNTRIAFSQLQTASYGIVSGLENMSAVGPTLQRSADLAVAANGDIASTSNAIINTMNTFGKQWGNTMTEVQKTDKIFAIMTNIVGRYKTDVNLLSDAMAYATPMASMLGLSLEGTAASVATLQTKGIQGARAGNTYAMMLRGLLQLTSKFKDKKVQAKSGAMDLTEFFDTYTKAAAAGGLEKKKAVELKKAMEDGGVATADAFTAAGVPVSVVSEMLEAFGEEPMRGWATLLGEWEQLREAAANAGDLNAALESLNDAQTTAAGGWAIMKNTMNVVFTDIGDQFLPVLKSLTTQLIRGAKWLREFFKIHPTATKWIAWGTAVGGALMFVGGAITVVYSKIMMFKTLRAMTALMGQMNGATKSAGLFRRSITLLSRGIKGLIGLLSLARLRTIGLAVASGVAAAAIGIAKTATLLWNAVMAANPIGLIVLAVAALVAGIVLLIKNWDLVKIAATIAIDWVLVKVDQMTESIKETLRFLGLLEEEQPKQMMIAGAPGMGMPVHMPVSDVTAIRTPIYHDMPDTSEPANLPVGEMDLLAAINSKQTVEPKVTINVTKDNKQSDVRTGKIVTKEMMLAFKKWDSLGVHGEG